MQRLLMLGLNHSTAPLEVRERLAFSSGQREAALQAFHTRFADAEAVLLSTCNRVELYTARAVHGHPRAQEMAQFLADFHGVDAEQFRPHLYEKADRDVVGHLFSVAASLDSMVLGETQILGQVRESYDAARQAGSAGALLNPLFQRALAVGKQVMNDTGITEGRMSIASVAVDYARQIFDHFADKTVLSIGGGKMASLVLQGFAALAPKRLLVCNRDAVKAEALAARFGGQAAEYEALERHLVTADVVVASTAAQQPIITRHQFEALLTLRRYRPIFLIDIALPRNIDPGAGELDNVYLYNLDDLQHVVAATFAQRRESIHAARQIIDRQVEQFITWHQTREMGPVIDQLYRRHHQLAQEELQRTLNKLGPIGEQERAHLEELARRIVNKLLHDPIQALRRSGEFHMPASQYLHALEKLFRLDREERPPQDSDGRTGQG
jgi:glutamyl-tRNA reductase